MRKQKIIIATLLLILMSTSLYSKPQIGQSAIAVLAFPWGGRSLGMAETFTGIADNEEAIFYNPAGLGQNPLAKSWIHYFQNKDSVYNFVQVVAKKNKSLKDPDVLWAYDKNNVIYKFNGVTWVNYSTHVIDSGEGLTDIANSLLDVHDFNDIDSAVNIIKRANNIGLEHLTKIKEEIKKVVLKPSKLDSLSQLIATLPASEQNETDILGYLYGNVPDDKGSELSKKIVNILLEPTEFEDMLQIDIPYSIGPKEINTLFVDNSNVLWVGSNKGLWKYNGTWKQFTVKDGLTSDTITAVTSYGNDMLLIGGNKGIVTFTSGKFKPILPNKIKEPIVALAFDGKDNIYYSTMNDLYLLNGEKTLLSIKSKLKKFNEKISTIMVDSKKRIWIGSEGGISIFNGKKWKQYEFKGSTIRNFAEADEEHFWISTSKGAVEYIEKPGKAIEWKFYHADNGLPSSDITSVVVFGDDIWLTTTSGISEFKSGKLMATAFFEQLLPSLVGIDDIWHAAVAATIPIKEWGALGVNMNFLNFGSVPNYNPDGTEGASQAAFEFSTGLSYGLPVKKDFSLGFTMKYAHSKLSEDATANSISFDAALLKTNLWTPRLSLGFSMLNMGPAVYYNSEDNKDPIPFTLRYGMSYVPVETPAIKFLVAFDLDREITFVDDNGEPYPFFKAIWYDLFDDPNETVEDEFAKIILHTGLEFTYANLISGRMGYMHDKAGSRDEITAGIGLTTKIILADFGMIFTLGENDVRNNQIRFSLTYAR